MPYKRIYGVDEPKTLAALANDGKLSTHLPEGTPFGLVGTSSLYKRESYPNGVVTPGQRDRRVRRRHDATGYKDLDPFNTHGDGASLNWVNQGADAGPLRQRRHPRHPHPGDGADDRPQQRAERRPHVPQPRQRAAAHPRRDSRCASSTRTASSRLDPDGNPDTSFLAKIPADVAWTFQTLDKDGMVLNMAQTWHQVRPGEVRNDCGGCHAHSQKPTDFKHTAAAKPDYAVFDLTRADAAADHEGKDDESKQEVGREGRDRPALREGRQERRVLPRRQADPRAQLRRLPHAEGGRSPPGNLVLDDDKIGEPAGQRRRARARTTGWRWTPPARFGHKPVIGVVARGRTRRATSACSSRGAAC